MKQTVVVLLVLLGVVSGVRAAGMPSKPALALIEGGLGNRSRLIALEPRTLEPRGSLALPGWAFGREWARSPDGRQLALVPKPSETDEHLFVISIRGSLRVLARTQLPRGDVCRLAWPSSRNLLVVLTRGPACTNAIDGARLLVVDPLRARVVAQHPLSGPTTVVASAPARGGLVLLLVPSGRSSARLLLVRATGARAIRLPRLREPRPLDKSLLGSAVGLAVERKSGRAYLVEPEGRVIDVNLASAEVGVHALPLRKPAAAAKGIAGSAVQALSLRPGLLAITGIRQATGGRLGPLGLWLLDTSKCRARLLEAEATGITRVGTTLLAFQPSFDQIGRGTKGIGLRGYRLDGSLTFQALGRRPIVAAPGQGRYVYAAGPGAGDVSVVDLSDGRVEPRDPDAISVSSFELLAGSSP